MHNKEVWLTPERIKNKPKLITKTKPEFYEYHIINWDEVGVGGTRAIPCPTGPSNEYSRKRIRERIYRSAKRAGVKVSMTYDKDMGYIMIARLA